MNLLHRSLFLLLAAFPLVSFAGDRDDDDDDGGGRRIEIRTLSTPADRVSGGDVLVEIANAGKGRHGLEVSLNGRDVTAAFRRSGSGTLVGLVSGLEVGKNKLSAGGRGQPKETLEITNYPLSGPITSGPHITPFICQTHSFLLPDGTPYTAAPVTHPTCSAPTGSPTCTCRRRQGVRAAARRGLPANVARPRRRLGRRSSSSCGSRPAPSIAASTRVRSCTIRRSTRNRRHLRRRSGWNRRLIAVEGFGCTGGWYRQGASIGNITSDGMEFVLLRLPASAKATRSSATRSSIPRTTAMRCCPASRR